MACDPCDDFWDTASCLQYELNEICRKRIPAEEKPDHDKEVLGELHGSNLALVYWDCFFGGWKDESDMELGESVTGWWPLDHLKGRTDNGGTR